MLEVFLGDVSELCCEARLRGRAALGRAEWLRFQGIAAPRRREQFLAAHWLARRSVLALCPELRMRVTIGRDAGGAPVLPRHPELFLSLTHSGSVVGCAVSSAPVGIDLEQLGRNLDAAAAGRVVCSQAERRWLAAGGGDASCVRFLQLWSLKEAWFKSRRRPMWLHAMASARARPARASQCANALSSVHATRGVVMSLVGEPEQIARLGANWAATAATRWQVEETNVDGR